MPWTTRDARALGEYRDDFRDVVTICWAVCFRGSRPGVFLWTRSRVRGSKGTLGAKPTCHRARAGWQRKTSLLQAGIFPLLQAEDVLPVGRVAIGTSFPKAALPEHNPYTLSVLSTWCPAESSSTLALRSLTDFLRDRAMTGDWPVPSLGIFVMVDQLGTCLSAHAKR